MLNCLKNPKGISFKVYVQPKASKNEIVGMHGNVLKIRLTAPPVDGAANKMCLKYLAKCLAVPTSRLEILSGQKSRTKHVLLKNEGDNAEAGDFIRLKEHVGASLAPKETA